MNLKLRKSRRFTLVLVLMLAVFFFTLTGTVTVHASVKMPGKLYKLVKGKWYTEASSGGYNAKFTKTRIKYCSRSSNKVVYSRKLVKVKKIKKGQYKGRYRLIFKNSHGKVSYINTDRKAKHFDFYGSASGYKGYSGRAGLARGKW